MQTTLGWLARRLAGGSATALFAMALTLPNAGAQTSSSETAASDNPSSTGSDDASSTDSTDDTRSTGTSPSNQYDSDTASRQRQDREEATSDDDRGGPSLGTRREERQSARDTARDDADEDRDNARDARETARDSARAGRQSARTMRRDTRENARDNARDSRDETRDILRDERQQSRDARRDYRDDRQEARRDTRETARDMSRDEAGEDWRGDLRSFARDTARDAVDYGRRTARDAMDTARDSTRRDRDAGREWEDFGRDAARARRDFDRESQSESRRFARDEGDDRRSRDDFDDRRDRSLDSDSWRDSRNGFAEDRFQDRDDRESVRRDSFRDNGDERQFSDAGRSRDVFRSDRDSRIAGDRARDFRDNRVSRSRIENFRASSVSANDLGLSLARSSRGLIVDDIGARAIARDLGLRRGDRIVAVEDYRVNSEDQFIRYLFDEDWRNDRIEVVVVRDGRQVPIYVRPAQLIEQLVAVDREPDPLTTFGVRFDDRYDDYLVVRQVWPNTPAYRAGLRAGDTIVRFYDRPIYSPRDFVRVLSRVDAQNVPIEIQRDRRLRELQVSLPAELRTTNQSRTTYRQNLQDNRAVQWSDQGSWSTPYGAQVYDQGTPATSSGVIVNEPATTVYPRQYQPAQPAQPSSRIDNGRDRPGLLPRLFNR